MSRKEEGKREKEGRNVGDIIHELHVLYMKYFSLDDPWQPIPNRATERAKLLRHMAVCVDNILNTKERPNWLHPAMFHGSLTSAICSLPPIFDKNAILMPPTINPCEIYWSKFSICNHSRPLENKPFIVSLQYHPPYPLQVSQNFPESLSSTSGITSEVSSSAQINDKSTAFSGKNILPRVGALPNNKFRNARQIGIECFVGEILRIRGIQFNRSNEENRPKAYLYQLPSSTYPIYE